MSEKRIPITRKQHDRAVALSGVLKAAQRDINMYCESLLDGLGEERPAECVVKGVDDTDGVYALIVEISQPPAGSTR